MGKSKNVSGYGSSRRVKCHHSVSSPLKPAAIIGLRRLEPVRPHLAADAPVVGVGERVEAVIARAHVDRVVAEAPAGRLRAVAQAVAAAVALLAARRQLDEREVHRAAAAVAGLARDVALLEEDLLAHARVELGLHPAVREVLGPLHEGVDRALRPVAVVDLERVALRAHGRLDPLERLGGGAGEQADVLAVARDAAADEVVGRQVAHLDHDRGVDVGQRDEGAGRRGGLGGGSRSGREEEDGSAPGRPAWVRGYPASAACRRPGPSWARVRARSARRRARAGCSRRCGSTRRRRRRARPP